METMSICRPIFVQRCTLVDGKLHFDYMGSFEFERGDQATALEKIFKSGIVEKELSVTAKDGKKVTIYALAAKGFDFDAYAPYLQRMADNDISLQDPSYFDDVVNGRERRLDAWFDFTTRDYGENAVFWTVTPEKQRQLLAALREIEKAWA
jgi:hypothetical protein